jgi:hypothetical protein
VVPFVVATAATGFYIPRMLLCEPLFLAVGKAVADPFEPLLDFRF